VAALPAGYFFYTDEEFQNIIVNHTETEVYAKGGTVLAEELKEVLELVKQIKDIRCP